MKKTVWIYGAGLAILIAFLKYIEYRYYIHQLSAEIYLAAIALLFTTVGIWAGLKLNKSPGDLVKPPGVITNQAKNPGLSQREIEVLQLIAEGHSNQEIAEKLFISIHTIKTHTSNLFNKLQVKRRTQAIQKAREMNLL